MKRLGKNILASLTMFALGIALTGGYRMYTQSDEQISACVPPLVSSTILNNSVPRLIFSSETYYWSEWDQKQGRYQAIALTGDNDLCYLARIGEPGMFVPAKITKLCRRWDGRGDVIECLKRQDRERADK